MDEDTKREFDALAELRSAAWESYSGRREHEWKVSLALWTSLSALTGFALGRDLGLKSRSVCFGALIVALIVLFLHTYWLHRLAKSNQVDRGLERHFRRLMCLLLTANSVTPELERKIVEPGQAVGLANYAHAFQLGITAVLAGCMVTTTLWRFWP
jgi:hypothetical protein